MLKICATSAMAPPAAKLPTPCNAIARRSKCSRTKVAARWTAMSVTVTRKCWLRHDLEHGTEGRILVPEGCPIEVAVSIGDPTPLAGLLTPDCS